MTRVRRTALVAVVCWGVASLWAQPVSAAGALTVTPSSDLVDQPVAVHGSGWPAATDVGYCQGVQDGTPSQSDCGGPALLVRTDASGTFDDPAYQVRRFIFVPSIGRTVDCAVEACGIGAAEPNDIANTAVHTPISFDPALPDARIRNRADGSIRGDDVYNTTGAGQTLVRRVPPGSRWTFAVQLQNDGPARDSFTIRANAAAPPFTVRYFYGFFDVTSRVTGAGATTGVVPSGEVRTIGVQIRVAADAPAGARFASPVTFTSTSAARSDTVVVGVVVQTPI